MGVKYSAAFDLTELRDGTTDGTSSFAMQFTASVGSDFEITSADFTLAMALHGYALGAAENHEGNTVFAATYPAGDFASLLASIITSKMAAATPTPWTGSISVTFDTATGRYTIARETGTFTFTIAWSSARSGRALLGFSANQSTAATHTGTLTPLYWIDATLDGRSMDQEGDYEPGGIADLAISDDATTYAGVTRTTSPKYRTWFQHFELKAKVFKAAVTASDPWAFEHLFETCRTVYPFVCDDGVESMACVFLPEGSSFRGKQRPGGPGDDVHFHVPFMVWHAAIITGG